MPAAPGAKIAWELAAGASIVPGRKVVEPLGGGRRYEVYLVRDERLQALAVAKLLRPDRVGDEGALRKLRREANLLSRLAHPALVRGLDAVPDGDRPHLLLEHVEGENVRRLVRQDGPLAPDEAAEVGAAVASALHYLAGEGLLHLDVKPSNVVLGPTPRLIDLGAARPVAAAARLEVPHGTDSYMAPELCVPGRGGAIGPAADVWSLGATLYYGAVGTVPFPRPAGARASGDPDVRFPQLWSPPEPVPDYVPRPLADLIVRLLAREPAERPAAAAAADELASLLA